MSAIEHLESLKAGLLKEAAEIDTAIRLLQGQGGSVPRPQKAATRRPVTARGTVSMAQAALAVLEEAQEPMHTADILAKAEEMGAKTTAHNGPEALDLLLYKQKGKGASIKKIEGKPRTWQWDAATGKEVSE